MRGGPVSARELAEDLAVLAASAEDLATIAVEVASRCAAGLLEDRFEDAKQAWEENRVPNAQWWKSRPWVPHDLPPQKTAVQVPERFKWHQLREIGSSTPCCRAHQDKGTRLLISPYSVADLEKPRVVGHLEPQKSSRFNFALVIALSASCNFCTVGVTPSPTSRPGISCESRWCKAGDLSGYCRPDEHSDCRTLLSTLNCSPLAGCRVP